MHERLISEEQQNRLFEQIRQAIVDYVSGEPAGSPKILAFSDIIDQREVLDLRRIAMDLVSTLIQNPKTKIEYRLPAESNLRIAEQRVAAVDIRIRTHIAEIPGYLRHSEILNNLADELREAYEAIGMDAEDANLEIYLNLMEIRHFVLNPQTPEAEQQPIC